jgi:hypothetical protein
VVKSPADGNHRRLRNIPAGWVEVVNYFALQHIFDGLAQTFHAVLRTLG